MPHIRPSPSTGWRRWLAALATRRFTLTPLGRDIVLILIAKAILLTLIWLAFFREPIAPGMSMEPQRVESRLLTPSPAVEPASAHR